MRRWLQLTTPPPALPLPHRRPKPPHWRRCVVHCSQWPPDGYSHREQLLEPTLAVVQARYPELEDLVLKGAQLDLSGASPYFNLVGIPAANRAGSLGSVLWCHRRPSDGAPAGQLLGAAGGRLPGKPSLVLLSTNPSRLLSLVTTNL